MLILFSYVFKIYSIRKKSYPSVVYLLQLEPHKKSIKSIDAFKGVMRESNGLQPSLYRRHVKSVRYAESV